MSRVLHLVSYILYLTSCILRLVSYVLYLKLERPFNVENPAKNALPGIYNLSIQGNAKTVD